MTMSRPASMDSTSLAALNLSGSDMLRAFGVGWTHAPWGIAAVGSDGKICAINPAFEHCTGIASIELLGQPESVLNERLEMTLFDHRRIEVNTSGVLAVHYISNAIAEETIAQKLSRVAETLREPLTAVYGFTELMLRQNYDDAQRQELLETMVEQIQLISGIINTHLDQSSLET